MLMTEKNQKVGGKILSLRQDIVLEARYCLGGKILTEYLLFYQRLPRVYSKVTADVFLPQTTKH